MAEHDEMRAHIEFIRMELDKIAGVCEKLDARLGGIEKSIAAVGGVWLAVRWSAIIGAGLWAVMSWAKEHVRI